jgi:hypothetical protein
MRIIGQSSEIKLARAFEIIRTECKLNEHCFVSSGTPINSWTMLRVLHQWCTKICTCSFSKNRRDLFHRTRLFICFNIIKCEFWRNGVHRERHLPCGELRGNDTFSVFRILTMRTSDESPPRKKQLMESVGIISKKSRLA